MPARSAPLRRLVPMAALALAATAFSPIATSHAAPSRDGCLDRDNNTFAKLLGCVTLDGVRAHQAEFQAIADANDDPYYPGSRAAGTKGYADSVDYVAGLLEDAGYTVTLDEFEFLFSFPATLEQLSPVTASYETGVFTGSGFGEVTSAVTPVDLVLGPGNASTSGCEAADFAGFPAGNIALVQRGACNFSVKALNAEAAGASAVVIFNQGNSPDREGLIVGTLGGDNVVGIPVVGASYPAGVSLAEPGSTAYVDVKEPETRTDVNVIAERPGADEDNVVMAGAHLDSVEAGPGINDNGSGSAAILETALMMAGHEPQNTLRFAWWGAEEHGLIGSEEYVEGLSQAEKDRIALYMNYDMVGSPNHVLMVYDADETTWPAPAGVPIPSGSKAIEDVYESFYTAAGEEYDDAQFSGRSDYEAFILNGIPSGGLFTGAEVVKDAEQASIWGGTAGEQFDPCYHQACDTFDNNNDRALELNSDLVAHAMLTFAYSTQTVNGVPGTAVPGRATAAVEPAGAEGTFCGDAGTACTSGARIAGRVAGDAPAHDGEARR